MDERTSKRDHRIEAVKGYVLATFPDDELPVKAYDGDPRWHIQVIRAHHVVHEARVLRRFFDDEDRHPDRVAARTWWGLAATMNMNGPRPVTIVPHGCSP